jgi:putative FmdB family regulatory protein
MPTYEFTCPACGKDFSTTTSVKDLEQGKITCPNCGAKEVKQQMAVFTSKTSRKS